MLAWMTVDDGDLTDYLTELRVAGRSPETLRVRRYQVRGWLAWLAGQGVAPATATRSDAVAFLATFPDPQTRAAYRSAIRGFHEWLTLDGRRADDPTSRLPAVHCPAGMPHPIPDALVIAALAHATDAHRAMILLGRFAGLRVSEIAAAHCDYLCGPHGQQVVRLRGKGGRVRELPAHPLVVGVLTGAAGWVFPSPKRAGRPIRAATVSLELSELLPGQWTAHSLRHAFATEAYARTKDLRLVQEWLGHRSPMTTIGYVGITQNFDAMRAMHLTAA
jgi:site-specific recombinase XerD